MSALHHSMSSNLNVSFDETQWVTNVRRTLDEELEDDTQFHVCIFNVPKMLMSSDPDSYTPQQVALGPYHYWLPELFEMQRYKLAAAKRIQKQLQSLKFQPLVEQLRKLEPRIRGCYHKYLDFNGETLSWMMAIDASFLLEFLQIYTLKEGKTISRVSSRMSHLVDYAGMKSGHNAILRDIVMLENQIPLFVLRKILEFQFSSLESADDTLLSMFMGLCKELSPLKMIDQDLPKVIEVSEFAHILDFFYHMIVRKEEEEPSDHQITVEVEDHDNEVLQGKEKSESAANSSYVKQFLKEISNLYSILNKCPLRFIKKLLSSKSVTVMLRLPWKIVSNLPGFAILKVPLEYLFSRQYREEANQENANSSSKNNINKPPLVEEITIPSVTELSKSGVCFVPTNGNLSKITFDVKTFTFYLPTISLDVNTEVILRNLVAYEASNASGPLVFTRYTELMNGIIDTGEDVKLLSERGIVFNRLKSNKEAANLWNGMSRSVRLTKVAFLDKVIEDVNKYYNGRWRVKFGKFIKPYVYSSWQFLTLMAAILLLLLLSLQAFCTVNNRSRVFRIKTTQ